jgi:DNA-binding transcriptional LysR family regulator
MERKLMFTLLLGLRLAPLELQLCGNNVQSGNAKHRGIDAVLAWVVVRKRALLNAHLPGPCGRKAIVKIDFDGIQAFVVVAEAGGFGKAANRLHVTQTALSRRVKKLEDYLGARLIDRTTRSIELTPVGREFLPHAARLVTDTTLAVGRVKDQSRLGQGNIIMASIPTMAHHALPAVIRKYTQRYPNNRIRIIESGAFEVNRTVIHENAEFGLTLELERHPQLLEQRVLREPFMFFCREDHPLGKSRSVNWNDLQQAELNDKQFGGIACCSS